MNEDETTELAEEWISSELVEAMAAGLVTAGSYAEGPPATTAARAMLGELALRTASSIIRRRSELLSVATALLAAGSLSIGDAIDLAEEVVEAVDARTSIPRRPTSIGLETTSSIPRGAGPPDAAQEE